LLLIIANKALSSDNVKYAKLAEEVLRNILAGKNEAKLIRRLDREAFKIIVILRDNQTSIVNGHKAILAIHALAAKILESGFVLRQETLDLFQVFLEIEANQTKTIDGTPFSDEDWLNLKKSAEKQAEKMFKELGQYYIN
jgi:hypothetical protein